MGRVKRNINKKSDSSDIFIVDAYIRLSNEDGDKRESNSILNQKKLISTYIENQSTMILNNFYIDDGYTGTNFNRPAFKNMIKDIENKIINCVIVKDLSRFGRDYLEVGTYIEKYFVINNIRFISLNDNIDSLDGIYDILMPVKNIFNEQYSRDISAKVKSVMRTKQLNGEFIGAFAPYGYKKDKNNKNKLVIDEFAASIIHRIFSLYIESNGKSKIASILNNEHVAPPSVYKQNKGENYKNANRLELTKYWTYSTIHRILQDEVYIGNIVQHKYDKSTLKVVHRKLLDRQDWLVVKNMHEPIIDKTLWNQAQKLLSLNTRQIDFNNNIHLFAGFIQCGDCGRSMSKINRNDTVVYVCGSYKRFGNKICSQHKIEYKILESLILKAIQMSINNFVNMEKATKKSFMKQKDNSIIENIEQEIVNINIQLNKIYNLKKSLYEDYREKLLSKSDYIKYKLDYDTTEVQLKNQIETLNQVINTEKNREKIFEKEWFLDMKKYNNISKLDRIILAELIDVIKIYENKKIDIVFKFSSELVTLNKYLGC